MPVTFTPNSEAQRRFLLSDARFVGYIGGVGCVGPETRIAGHTVAELAASKKPFLVPVLGRQAVALGAFAKGRAPLYWVRPEWGEPVAVTAAHRFLTPDGWLTLGQMLRQGVHVIAGSGVWPAPLDNGGATDSARRSLHRTHPGGTFPTPEALIDRDKWRRLRSLCSESGVARAYALLFEISAHTRAEPSAYDNPAGVPPIELDASGVPAGPVLNLYRALQWLLHNDLGEQLPRREVYTLALALYQHVAHFLAEPQRYELSRALAYMEGSVDDVAYATPLSLFEDLVGFWSSYQDTSQQPTASGYWMSCQVEAPSEALWPYYDLYVPGDEYYVVGGMLHHNSGKTCAGAVKAVMKIDGGYDGAIVGPDFPQFAKSTWPEFAKWCPWSRCTNKHLDHPYTQKKILTFDVRGKPVTVYYGGIEDPQAWAGPNLNWVWMDEAGRKRTRKAFDVMAARIRLGDKPQLFTTTTPNGVRHWLYEVFVQGIFDPAVMKAIKDSGYTGKLVEYFHGHTKDNRANLDDLYYLTLTGMYDGNLAKQELEGAFISMEGRVWEHFQEQPSEERPYTNVTEEADYVGGVPVEWWVDDGFTRGHPRVILFAQVIPPYVNVFDEYIVEYEVAEESIRQALEKPYPRPSVAYVDSSAAELRHRLWDDDIDTISATHDVAEGIKHTAGWICNAKMEAHLRFHPRCTYSIAEIQSYVVDERGRPLKSHDNVADAVRYGLWPKQLGDIVADGEHYQAPKAEARGTLLTRLPGPRTPAQVYMEYVRRMQGLPVDIGGDGNAN